jgi:Cu/Ag efflux pump CusA
MAVTSADIGSKMQKLLDVVVLGRLITTTLLSLLILAVVDECVYILCKKCFSYE